MAHSRDARGGGRPARRVRHSGGFTLIELMVTVAVAGILAVVAVPAMTALVNGNRLAGNTSEMTSALSLARAEAIRRNAPVSICRSTNGMTCAGGADWSSWIVVSGTDVIRSNAATGNTQISGPAGGILFRSSGLIDGERRVTVCVPSDQPEQNQRVITVMVSGNLVTERASGGGTCP